MEYFILKPDGEQMGTFSIDQIRTMLSKGFIGWDTRYWHEGISEWRPVDRIEESLQFQPVPTTTTTTPRTTSLQQKPLQTSRAVPPPSSKIEKTFSPPAQPKQASDKPPIIPPSPPIRSEPPPVPETRPNLEAAPTKFTDNKAPKGKRMLNRVFYVVHVTLAALAINYAGMAARHISDWMQSKVTLAPGETFVLLDQASIKPFMDDIGKSPVVENLQHQIEQTTEPNALLMLKVGVQKEETRQIDEVEQGYFQKGAAAFIEPGTYRVLGYLDDKGEPITFRHGEASWVVISYKDHTVYAFRTSHSIRSAPSL